MERRIPFSEFVKNARPLVVEGYYYDFVHFPVDVPGFVRHIKQTGANLVRLGTLMGSHAAYPSRYVPTYRGIEGRDWVGEMMAECESAGLRVINYVATSTGWTCGNTAASKAVFAKSVPWHTDGVRPCLSGEALDWTIASFVETVKRYHPEALYIDGGVVPPLCRCPRCSKAFRDKIGGTIPRSYDLTDRWMMPYISWLLVHRASLWGKIIRACRRVVPDLHVIVNVGDWKNTLLHPRGEEALGDTPRTTSPPPRGMPRTNGDPSARPFSGEARCLPASWRLANIAHSPSLEWGLPKSTARRGRLALPVRVTPCPPSHNGHRWGS